MGHHKDDHIPGAAAATVFAFAKGWQLSISAHGLLIKWWSGVVVSALALIIEVNQRRARLVLKWVTVSGFSSRCGTFYCVLG